MKIKLLNDTMCPKHGRKGDAGYDFFLNKDVVLKAGETTIVDTGVCVKLPDGYAGLFAVRSSICAKYKNITLKNPLVDENYIGELHMIFVNTGTDDIAFMKGDRLASLYVFPVYQGDLEVVDELESTNRGTDWCGSSGK